jgi:hypothetical protein
MSYSIITAFIELVKTESSFFSSKYCQELLDIIVNINDSKEVAKKLAIWIGNHPEMEENFEKLLELFMSGKQRSIGDSTRPDPTPDQNPVNAELAVQTLRDVLRQNIPEPIDTNPSSPKT